MLLCEKDRKDNWELDNYFMNPTYVENIGLVHPIKLKNYNNFIRLANEYILLDVKKKNNLIQQLHEKAILNGEADRKSKPKLIDCDNIFDWYISQIDAIDKSLLDSDIKYIVKIKERLNGLKEEDRESVLLNNPEINNMLDVLESNNIAFNQVKEQLCELFKYTVHHEVVFNFELKRFDILCNNELYGFIDRDNFYKYRDVVMKQNIMHEPRIAPNLYSQRQIDKENKIKFSQESSIESIIAIVSSESNKNIEDYTYYRINADYKTIINKLDYLATSIYKANGCKDKNGNELKSVNLSEPLNLNKNPYTKDAIIVDEASLINKTE
ncbi:hypothetical protein [Clostridium paraputrificum]|uniref:hypothetical protein n=1 Tax=Clostridium paraputrificum TaxID=29363 RepID=UPI00189DAC53|nr:hypothetical protein [Clostridium paraputrificum]